MGRVEAERAWIKMLAKMICCGYFGVSILAVKKVY